MYIMVKTTTRTGRNVKTTEKKDIYDKEMEEKRAAAKRRQSKKWTISAKKASMFKGSELRKGVRGVERGVEDVGRAGVSGIESVGRVGVSGVKGVERGVESALTGLEQGFRNLSVKKVEDKMADLQKRMTNLGVGGGRRTRTKRRRNRKRARSTKKR